MLTMLQLFELASITLYNMTIDLKELIADYACNLSSEPIIHIVRYIVYDSPILVTYEGQMGEVNLRKDINDLYNLYSKASRNAAKLDCIKMNSNIKDEA